VTYFIFLPASLAQIFKEEICFVFVFADMAFYSSIVHGSGGGRHSVSSTPGSLHEALLNPILALNKNAFFIDLHSLKAEFSKEERSDFLTFSSKTWLQCC
jgi:hypothetical protein